MHEHPEIDVAAGGVSPAQTAVSLRWTDFSGLGLATLHALLRLRQDVFIVEQQSVYPDIDGQDPDCAHLLAEDGQGRLVGCLRARGPVGTAAAFIGRIVVAPDHRGIGLGRRLVQAGIDWMEAHHPGTPIRIGAQLHLQDYYAGFGFTTVGGVYEDGGVPHIIMWRRIAPPATPPSATPPSGIP